MSAFHDWPRMIAKLFSTTSLPAIEHEAMQQAVQSGECHIVDVREQNEFSAGHIPGAKSHPLSSFDPARLPKDKPVILVCQAGGRSARALQATMASGRQDVVHYAPGTGGWRMRGGAIAN
jgi:rhodanese-related sulfurtransferase